MGRIKGWKKFFESDKSDSQAWGHEFPDGRIMEVEISHVFWGQPEKSFYVASVLLWTKTHRSFKTIARKRFERGELEKAKAWALSYMRRHPNG